MKVEWFIRDQLVNLKKKKKKFNMDQPVDSLIEGFRKIQYELTFLYLQKQEMSLK